MKNGMWERLSEIGNRGTLVSGGIWCIVFILLCGDIPLLAQGLTTYDRSRRAMRDIEVAGLYG
jgi:hypothetical protein